MRQSSYEPSFSSLVGSSLTVEERLDLLKTEIIEIRIVENALKKKIKRLKSYIWMLGTVLGVTIIVLILAIVSLYR